MYLQREAWENVSGKLWRFRESKAAGKKSSENHKI